MKIGNIRSNFRSAIRDAQIIGMSRDLFDVILAEECFKEGLTEVTHCAILREDERKDMDDQEILQAESDLSDAIDEVVRLANNLGYEFTDITGFVCETWALMKYNEQKGK